MNGVREFFDGVIKGVQGAPLDALIIADLSAFGALFAIAALSCLFSERVRRADKRPFLCLSNAFTAITFAVFCTAFSVSSAAAFAAVFWLGGYLLYGILCALSSGRKGVKSERAADMGRPIVTPERASVPVVAPAAKNAVRLEHALSIADRLLMKNLGRGDRQELEKMKTTLSVLKIKGTLSAQEGETLNDIFNALLKLMARYDL